MGADAAWGFLILLILAGGFALRGLSEIRHAGSAHDRAGGLVWLLLAGLMTVCALALLAVAAFT